MRYSNDAEVQQIVRNLLTLKELLPNLRPELYSYAQYCAQKIEIKRTSKRESTLDQLLNRVAEEVFMEAGLELFEPTQAFEEYALLECMECSRIDLQAGIDLEASAGNVKICYINHPLALQDAEIYAQLERQLPVIFSSTCTKPLRSRVIMAQHQQNVPRTYRN